MPVSLFRVRGYHMVIVLGPATIPLHSGCYRTNDLVRHGEDQNYYFKGGFHVPFSGQWQYQIYSTVVLGEEMAQTDWVLFRSQRCYAALWL